ncbi:hypothetical protein Tco_1487270, partial [Tanacetum coccineum]
SWVLRVSSPLKLRKTSYSKLFSTDEAEVDAIERSMVQALLDRGYEQLTIGMA